jgi:hypothetical protein
LLVRWLERSPGASDDSIFDMSSPRIPTWKIQHDIVERQAAAVCDPNE